MYFYDLQFTAKYLIPSFRSCYVQGGWLTQVEITRKDKHRTATGWLRPLNRGGHLIKVTKINIYSVCMSEKSRFESWPLN